MKAYIAGKITGDENYRRKFQTAREKLEEHGFTVINPAELPEGMRPEDYMRICLAMMDSADIVAFLPDYDQSRGARLEWEWCQYLSKTTIYLEQMTFYRRDPCSEQMTSTPSQRPTEPANRWPLLGRSEMSP